jgi:hypothetical protein
MSKLYLAKGEIKMKKILFFVLFFSLFYSLSFGGDYAVDKGSNMFGITAGFINASGDLYEDEEGSSSTTLLVMPSLAHCIVRNFGIGGDLLILHYKQGDTGLSTLGLGPKAMFFFGGKDSKAYPYLTLGFYYVRNTIDYGKYDQTDSGTRFKFGGGASIMIASHLGLLMEASYNLDNLKRENAKKSRSGNMLIVSMGLAGFTF